ncbi:RNA pol II accessory factor, Cdc73 family-domain-containing protein [Lipomyces oligophaga]|uniref:RNA pol II accessory factor, Cdc73 family-domain-containing protein n=1 Tax=Lipomyces oligophaga TaxID=45792 RepID=UPI0034CD81B6
MLASADPQSDPVDDIAKATHLTFVTDPSVAAALDLSVATRFVRQKTQDAVDLRAILFCWQQRDENVATYLRLCEEKGVTNLSFIERTSLVTWLQGADENSEFITPLESERTTKNESARTSVVDSASTQTKLIATPKSKAPLDPHLVKIYSQERVLLNHNSVLHGSKPTNFDYVRKEAFASFLLAARERSQPTSRSRAQTSTTSTSSAAGISGQARSGSGKRRDPIILLSPSASALITMSNVKDFLERGTYTSTPASSSAVNIQMITRHSQRLGQLRFVVVDSVERFKPDYWDRVVAVVTTGQTWQFRSYARGMNDPNVLFQKVKGFCVSYSGDPLPENIRSWNVDVVQVDKVHRFRDRETVEGMWDSLEKWMEARGWGTRGR